MSKAPVENCGVPGIHRGAVPPVNGRISQAGQVIKIAVICTAIQISRKKYAGQPICIGPKIGSSEAAIVRGLFGIGIRT